MFVHPCFEAESEEDQVQGPRRKKKEFVPKFSENLGMDHLEEEVGQFRKDYLDLSDENYDFLRKQASSTLSKAFSLELSELETLIRECRNDLSPEQVMAKVEALTTTDCELVLDGTYM